MIPPCKCKPMQSTTLGKSLRRGIVELQVNFCACCEWNGGLWEDLDWGDCCSDKKWYKDNSAPLLWCCVGWNYNQRIWDRLYIFNISFQFQNTKKKEVGKHKSLKDCHSGRNKERWSRHFVKFLSATYRSVPLLWLAERGEAEKERWAQHR